MEPSRMEVEKHSLMNEVELLDFCQEYHRQASPGWQKFCCSGSDSSNMSQSGLLDALENRLPHW